MMILLPQSENENWKLILPTGMDQPICPSQVGEKILTSQYGEGLARGFHMACDPLTFAPQISTPIAVLYHTLFVPATLKCTECSPTYIIFSVTMSELWAVRNCLLNLHCMKWTGLDIG